MDKHLSAMTGFIECGHLLVVDIDTWMFMDWDLNTDTYDTIADLKPVGEYKLCWIQKILKYKNSYYFMQRNSKQLIEYDAQKKEVVRHGLDYLLGDSKCIIYSGAYIWEDYLYMMPFSYDGMITVFDMKSKRYIQEYRMVDLFGNKEIFGRDKKILSYVLSNDKLWFCVEKSNLAFCLDIQTMQSICFNLDAPESLYMATGGEEGVFLTEIDSYRFYEYDSVFNIFRNHDVHKQQMNHKLKGYRFIFRSTQSIVAIDKEMKAMDIIGADDRNIETIMFPDELCNIFELRRIDGIFYGYIFKDKKVYLPSFSGNGTLEIDLFKYDIKYHCLKISHRDVVCRRYYGEKMLYENSDFKLDELCYILNKLQDRSVDMRKTCTGLNIYKKLTGLY
ncbi:MAG: hypothetical protein J6C19_03670 [Lachnospiraceae bacterium]|nr:hypothetical protein [Lachnospiraceae bacterium]